MTLATKILNSTVDTHHFKALLIRFTNFESRLMEKLLSKNYQLRFNKKNKRAEILPYIFAFFQVTQQKVLSSAVVFKFLIIETYSNSIVITDIFISFISTLRASVLCGISGSRISQFFQTFHFHVEGSPFCGLLFYFEILLLLISI